MPCGFRNHQSKTSGIFSGVMLSKLGIALSGVLLLIAFAPRVEAQRNAHSLQTYTAPDGAFTFRYWSELVNCAHDPGENCAAYHPVCDGAVGEDQTSIVCLAYRRNKYTDTQAFEAATFSIEVLNYGTRSEDCLATPSEEKYLEPRGMKTIHGVVFAVYEFGEGGMNQGVGGRIYRAFHRGKCYQLGINVATADAQVFDPPARDLTAADWREVNGRLERARDSFRFLK